jgi:hypothetical protein
MSEGGVVELILGTYVWIDEIAHDTCALQVKRGLGHHDNCVAGLEGVGGGVKSAEK